MRQHLAQRLTSWLGALLVALSLTLAAAAQPAHASPTPAGGQPAPALTAPALPASDAPPPMDTRGLDHTRVGRLDIWSVPAATAGFAKVADRAAPKLDQIERYLGSDDTAPIRVVVLEDLNDYFTRRGVAPRAPAWAVGLSISADATVLIKWGRSSQGAWVDLNKTLVHELAHMALDRAIDHHDEHAHGASAQQLGAASDAAPVRHERRVPRWLHEGFAIYMAGEWTLERSTSVIEASVGDNIIPLTHLRNRFPAAGPGVELAYAESYLFMQHLHQTHGEPDFQSMIAKMRGGQSFEEAFDAAYGRRFHTEEAGWRSQLELSHGWLPSVLGSSAFLVLGGIILALGWRRKRRQFEARMEQMGQQEERWGWNDAPQLPLPGLGLSTHDIQARPWRVLRDGTVVPRHDSAAHHPDYHGPQAAPAPAAPHVEPEHPWASAFPTPQAAPHPQDDLPRTPGGHVIH